MRILTGLMIPVLFGLPLLSASLATAQSSTTIPVSTPKSAAASAKCHTTLEDLQERDENYFAQKTDEELASIQSQVDDCLRNSYPHLSKFDLSVAGQAASIIARQIQARLDQVGFDGLMKDYLDLKKKMTPRTDDRTITLTISPLPNGFKRTLTVMGHENACFAVESMQLLCQINVSSPGLVIPTRLIAMIATPKPLPMFEHSFLMGCNPDLSANCSALVPGDYPAEYVGADGVSVGGLVTEDKPDAPPHHGAYTIYHRGEIDSDR